MYLVIISDSAVYFKTRQPYEELNLQTLKLMARSAIPGKFFWSLLYLPKEKEI